MSEIIMKGTFGALEEAVVVSWKRIQAQFDVQLKSRTVRLTTGKYAGRLGRLDAICMDETHGLLYLVMVLRADGSGEPLNSDGESRSYWPQSLFVLATEG